MAKKKIDFKLDDYGFDTSLDTDFDFDFGTKPQKNDRNPVTRAAIGVAKGVRSSLSEENFIRQAVRDTLPRGYGSALDLGFQARDVGKDLYNTALEQTRPLFNELKRATARALPRDAQYKPGSLKERLQRWSQTAEQAYKPYSYQAQNESEISGALSEIFQLQADNEDRRYAEQEAKDRVKQTLEFTKHKESINQLNAMRISLQQMANYQAKVNYGFQRKMLELQYRTFFVNRELLNRTVQGQTENKALLEGILKNTGLPDFVKLKQSERFKEAVRNRFIDQFTDGLLGYRRDFLKNVGTRLSQSIRGQLSGITSGLLAGLQGAGQAADELRFAREAGVSVDPYGLGGEILGNQGAYFASSQLGRRLRRRIGKNARIDRLSNTLQYQVSNLPQTAEEWARGPSGSGGLMGGLVNMLKDAVLAGRPGRHLDVDNVKNLQEPGVFTRQTAKSINEIIPGLLSRIHQELKIIRTGDAKTEPTVYDFTTNKFTEQSTARSNLLNRTLSPFQRESVRSDIDALIKTIDPNSTLSPDAKIALGQQLLRDNMNNRKASPERLANRATWTGSAAQYADQFANLFSRHFAHDSRGGKRVRFSERYNDLGRFIDMDRAQLQNLVNAGLGDVLSDAGILNLGPGERGPAGYMDFDKYFSYYYGGQYNPSYDAANGGVRSGAMGPTPSNISRNVTRNINIGGNQAELLNAIHAINPNQLLSVIGQTLSTISAQLAAGIPSYQATAGQAQASQQMSEGASEAARKNMGFWGAAWKVTSTVGSHGLRNVTRLRNFANSVVGNPLQRLRALSAPIFTTVGQAYDTATSRGTALFDVFVEGESKPRLEAWKLKAGDYRDAATGATIRNYRDIKGAIVDKAGNVVLGLEDVKRSFAQTDQGKKMLTALGALSAGANRVRQSLFSRIASLDLFNKGLFQRRTEASGEEADDSEDIYLPESNEPVLQAWKLRAGEYYDASTKKVIRSYADIRGNVVDSSGRVVLKASDLKRTVVKTYRGFKPAAFAQRAATFIDRQVGSIFKGSFGATGRLLDLGRSVLNSLTAVAGSAQDLFVRGQRRVKLKASELRAGHYVDATTGQVIRKWSDIRGAVEDRFKNVVLTDEEYEAGLVDRAGNPIRSAIGGIGRGLGAVMNFARNGIARAGSFLTSGVTDGLANTGRLLRGTFGNLFSGMSNRPVVNRLTQIYNLLKARLGGKGAVIGDVDGDGIRDGSYEDQKRKAEEAEKEAREDARFEKLAGAGFGGSLYGALGGLAGKFWNRKKGEEEGDGDGDNYIYAGGGGGGDEKGKGGKGKGGGKGGGRGGRLGRWGRRAAGIGGGLLSMAGTSAALYGGLGLLDGDVSATNLGLVAGGLAATNTGRAALKGAAKFAGRAGWQLGRLAWGLGSWLVATLGAPVVIGGLAAAGAAYGAYKGYQYLTRRKLQPLSKVRFAQYGYVEAQKEYYPAIVQLEETLMPAVKFGSDGIADLDSRRIDIKKIIDIFDIDPNDQAATQNFAQWFLRRFKPVFMTNLTALRIVGAKDVSLSDVDDKLKPEEKLKFLEIASFPGGPYTFNLNPFPTGDLLPANADTVAALVKEAKETIAKGEEEKPKGGITPAVETAAGAAFGVYRRPGRAGADGENLGGSVVSTAAKGLGTYAAMPTTVPNRVIDTRLANTFQLERSGEKVRLIREPSTDSGTFGRLVFADGTSFVTLELPWIPEKPGSSCIPPGRYAVEYKRDRNTNQPTYEILNVPGRSGITLTKGSQAGNVDRGMRSDTRGSILVGMNKGQQGNQYVLLGTAIATDALMAKLHNASFIIEIISGEGANLTDTEKQALKVSPSERFKLGPLESSGSRTPSGASIPDDNGGGTGGIMKPIVTENGAAFGVFRRPGGGLSGLSANQGSRPLKRGDAKKNRELLLKEAAANGITDPNELAMFLAQTDHESGAFSVLEENLNYRPERLMSVFKKYFRSPAEAQQAAAGGPEAIANIVYGNRMGNNQPGDGWKYRGRGLIQLTGKNNYIAASKALGIDLVSNPDKASEPEIAAKIAVWYWQSRGGLAAAGQQGDVRTATKLINGGDNGLQDRANLFARYRNMIQKGELKPSEDNATGVPGEDTPATDAAAAEAAKQPDPAVAQAVKDVSGPVSESPDTAAPVTAPAAAQTLAGGFRPNFEDPGVRAQQVSFQQDASSSVFSESMGSMKDVMTQHLAIAAQSLQVQQLIASLLAGQKGADVSQDSSMKPVDLNAIGATGNRNGVLPPAPVSMKRSQRSA